MAGSATNFDQNGSHPRKLRDPKNSLMRPAYIETVLPVYTKPSLSLSTREVSQSPPVNGRNKIVLQSPPPSFAIAAGRTSGGASVCSTTIKSLLTHCTHFSPARGRAGHPRPTKNNMSKTPWLCSIFSPGQALCDVSVPDHHICNVTQHMQRCPRVLSQ